MERKSNAKLLKIVTVGLMAALTFALSLISIPIPTFLGISRIHLGNSMCILAGLLLGGMNGGLAAGIGSFIYDLTNPVYIASAPFTFISKFAMGFVAGKINRTGIKNSFAKALIGAIFGQIAYIILYLGKSFVTDLLLGNAVETAWIDVLGKLGTSSVNAVIAIVISIPLYFALKKALSKTPFAAVLNEKPESKGYLNPVTVSLIIFAFVTASLYTINLSAQSKINAANEKEKAALEERLESYEEKFSYLESQLGIEFPQPVEEEAAE